MKFLTVDFAWKTFYSFHIGEIRIEKAEIILEIIKID